MALEYGLIPRAHVKVVSDYVVAQGNQVGVPTFEDLAYGLHAGGRDDALVTALTDPSRPGYAMILAEGATFTWEAWDARTTGDSESHGWGAAIVPPLQEDILGVRIAAPGAAQVDVDPPDIDMSAHGVVGTQRGPVTISWARNHAGLTLDLTIPANVTATVHLTAKGVDRVHESGHALTGDAGIVSARQAGDEVVVTLGSGHYEFTAR